MNPFSLPAHHLRNERLASTLCFTLLIASWVVAYVALVPPDPVAHRTHVAQVQP